MNVRNFMRTENYFFLFLSIQCESKFTSRDFLLTRATFSIVSRTNSVFPSHINQERDSGTKPKKFATMTNGIGQIAIRIKARQLGKNIAMAGTATDANVFEIITISKG